MYPDSDHIYDQARVRLNQEAARDAASRGASACKSADWAAAARLYAKAARLDPRVPEYERSAERARQRAKAEPAGPTGDGASQQQEQEQRSRPGAAARPLRSWPRAALQLVIWLLWRAAALAPRLPPHLAVLYAKAYRWTLVSWRAASGRSEQEQEQEQGLPPDPDWPPLGAHPWLTRLLRSGPGRVLSWLLRSDPRHMLSWPACLDPPHVLSWLHTAPHARSAGSWAPWRPFWSSSAGWPVSQAKRRTNSGSGIMCCQSWALTSTCTQRTSDPRRRAARLRRSYGCWRPATFRRCVCTSSTRACRRRACVLLTSRRVSSGW